MFIMKSEEVQKLISEEKRRYVEKHQKPMTSEGLSWAEVLEHENKWEKLPS
jgi:transposase